MKDVLLIFVVLLLSSCNGKKGVCDCANFKNENSLSILVGHDGEILKPSESDTIDPLKYKNLTFSPVHRSDVPHDFKEVYKFENVESIFISLSSENKNLFKNLDLSKFEKLCKISLAGYENPISELYLKDLMGGIDSIPYLDIHSSVLRNEKILKALPNKIGTLKINPSRRNTSDFEESIVDLTNFKLRPKRIVLSSRLTKAYFENIKKGKNFYPRNFEYPSEEVYSILTNFKEINSIEELEIYGLYLSGNDAPDVNLRNLKKISFINCIVYDFPKELLEIPSLNSIAFHSEYYHKLRTKFPEKVEGLNKLNSICFTGVRADAVPEFPDSKQLQTIVYIGVDSSIAIPNYIENNINSIENFVWNHTRLTTAPDYINLMNLDVLNLDNNRLTSLDNISNVAGCASYFSYDINDIGFENRKFFNNGLSCSYKNISKNQTENISLADSLYSNLLVVPKNLNTIRNGELIENIIKQEVFNEIAKNKTVRSLNFKTLIIDSIPQCFYELEIEDFKIEYLNMGRSLSPDLNFPVQKVTVFDRGHIPPSVKVLTIDSSVGTFKADITLEKLNSLRWERENTVIDESIPGDVFPNDLFNNKTSLDTVILTGGEVLFEKTLPPIDLDVLAFGVGNGGKMYNYDLNAARMYIRNFPFFNEQTFIDELQISGKFDHLNLPHSLSDVKEIKSVVLLNDYSDTFLDNLYDPDHSDFNYQVPPIPTIGNIEELFAISGLKELVIDGFSIGELPAEISKAKDLEKFVLIKASKDPWGNNKKEKETNYLRKTLSSIPKEIGQLKKLTHLEITGDFRIIPEDIFKLQNLRTLMLSGRLTSIPVSVLELQNLETLSLSGRFEEINLDFTRLKNLKNLVLKGVNYASKELKSDLKSHGINVVIVN